MEFEKSYLSVLPDVYANAFVFECADTAEEIRMRVGQPMIVLDAGGEHELWPVVQQGDLEDVVSRACRYSVYSGMDTIREGYLTIEGGHRIGICGWGVSEGSGLKTLRAPSSLCIRIARQVRGVADVLVDGLNASTLILGPPGRGKTTLLRDAVRLLSDVRKKRIGLADERGEIAACVGGVPQLDVGCRTDIMSNVRKDIALTMLQRTMNPQWIAVDEITAERDILAMEQAAYCGTKLLATAHACDVEDLSCRPLYRRLLELQIFSCVVVIHPDRECCFAEVNQ